MGTVPRGDAPGFYLWPPLERVWNIAFCRLKANRFLSSSPRLEPAGARNASGVTFYVYESCNGGDGENGLLYNGMDSGDVPNPAIP